MTSYSATWRASVKINLISMFIKFTSFFIHRILSFPLNVLVVSKLLGQLLSDGFTALHGNLMLKDVLSDHVGDHVPMAA